MQESAPPMVRIDPDTEFRRLPGLFRRWELVCLLVPGRAYLVEDAGATEDGSGLVAVWQAVEVDDDPDA